MKTKTKNTYLKNEDLANELQKWIDSAKNVEDRVVSDKLANMLLLIPKHMLGSHNFCGYPKDLQDDLVSDAFLKMMKNLKNYNPEKSSAAFNYFTRCTYCAFLTTIGKYYKQINIKRKLYEMDYGKMRDELPARNLSIQKDFE